MSSHRIHRSLAAAGAALLLPVAVPATEKPCRDAAGRIVKCEKVRKPVKRCKDANGKFVRCPAPASSKVSG